MAKKFKFKLDSVLRYREMIEEDRKREFAIANRAVEEQKAKARELEEEREGMQNALREMYSSGGKLQFNALVNSVRYVGGLDMGIASSYREASRLEQEMEGKRQAFVESRRDKRALEILKEKKQDAHEDEANKERQQILDELSMRLFKKRLAEEELNKRKTKK